MELSASTRSQSSALSADVGDVVDEMRRRVVAESVALEEELVAEVADHHGGGAVVDGELGVAGPKRLPSSPLPPTTASAPVILGFFVLIGLGIDPSWDLLLKASFIMPAATLASALLLTPGGLGVAEGGIVGLSQVLLDLGKGPAAVGALVIRFGTLWFGVIVGIIALVLVTKRAGVLPNKPEPGAEEGAAIPGRKTGQTANWQECRLPPSGKDPRLPQVSAKRVGYTQVIYRVLIPTSNS